MDFVNRAQEQLVELFRSMTPGARITAGLLLAIIVISLAYLFRWSATGDDAYLFGAREFSQSEIADMEGAFAQAGLSRSEIVANRIRIPRGEKAAYLAALADAGALPRNFGESFENAVRDSNPFLSSRDRDSRLKNAKQQELSLIISQMKGIERATVQYDETDLGGFPRRKEVRAMIAVQPEPGADLEGERVRAIRDTVRAAIAGLEPKNITVTDLNGHSYTGAGADGLLHASDDPYATRKQWYEKHWEEKISEKLGWIPKVVVGVNVQLDPEVNRRENMLEYDSRPVAVNSSDYSKESSNTRTDRGGRPGAAPNGVTNQAATVSTTGGSESSSSETRSESQAVTGSSQVVSSRASLTPREVTASVAIPVSYYVKVWRDRAAAANDPNAPAAPDEAALLEIEEEIKNQVEDVVVNLLPLRGAGDDPFPRIAVNTYQDLPGPMIEPPTAADAAASWLGANWPVVGMLALGLVSLLMLRRTVRAPTPDPSPNRQGAAAVETGQSGVEEDDENEEEGGRRGFADDGPNLREELASLVRDNPDAAANVLRSWIGDAA